MGDEKIIDGTSSEVNSGGSIRDKTSAILATATSEIRHGRGRRPANCPCADCVQKRSNPASNSKSAAQTNVAGNAGVDASYIAETVSSALGVLTELARDTARSTLEEIVEKDRANRVALKVGVSDESKKAIADLSGVVAKQYGVAGQHTPAVMLGALVVVTIGKNFLAFREIRQIVAEAKANAKPTSNP